MTSIERILQTAVAATLTAIARLLTGTSVHYDGCGHDDLNRQSIFFANHSSHLDFIVLWSALPSEVRKRTRPLAAGDYWTAGPLRRFLSEDIFHAILAPRRGGAHHTCAAGLTPLLEALSAGDSLILFPEGTRGDGEAMGPFHAGLYHLAQRFPEVQLVPVRLENLNRILPKGEVMPVPLLGRLTFGSALPQKAQEPKEAFLIRARNSLIALERTPCH